MTYSSNNYNQDVSNLTNTVNGLQNTVAALQSVAPLSGRNVVVNSSCSVAQVNGATLITPLTATYPIDNALFTATQASKLQSQQITNKLNSLGSQAALQLSVLSQYAPVSSDTFTIAFPIEGLNFARFQFGTAYAKTTSLQFKVNASVAGTYDGSIQNAAATRSYPFSYTVQANTDTLVTIPNIPGCVDGTWVATNALSAEVYFNLGSVESFRTFNNNNSGNWQPGNFIGIQGSTNFVNQVNGSTLAISEVQLEVGPACTPFERKLYNQELSHCQRYLYVISTNDNICGMDINTSSALFTVPFKVTMRVAPTGIVTTGTMANNLIQSASTSTACNGITFTSAGTNMGSITASLGTAVLPSNSAAAILRPNAGVIYFTGAQI